MQIELTPTELNTLKQKRLDVKQAHKQDTKEHWRDIIIIMSCLMIIPLTFAAIGVIFSQDWAGVIAFFMLMVTAMVFTLIGAPPHQDSEPVHELKKTMTEEKLGLTMHSGEILGYTPQRYVVETEDGFSEMFIAFTDTHIKASPATSNQEIINL